MDPASNDPVARMIALYDRLDGLYGELKPLEDRYRAWAQEFERTGVPHDKHEFVALVRRIEDLRHQVTDARIMLRALTKAGQ